MKSTQTWFALYERHTGCYDGFYRDLTDAQDVLEFFADEMHPWGDWQLLPARSVDDLPWESGAPEFHRQILRNVPYGITDLSVVMAKVGRRARGGGCNNSVFI